MTMKKAEESPALQYRKQTILGKWMKKFNTTSAPLLVFCIVFLMGQNLYTQTISGITSGGGAANGAYTPNGDVNGKQSWTNGSYYVYWSNEYGGHWAIDINLTLADNAEFFIASTSDVPPESGYTNGNGQGDPVLTGFTLSSATITFTDGSSFTPGINHGYTNQALGRFKLTADASDAALTDASIKLNGTRTGLSNLKLWSSTDDSYNSGSDTQIGSTVSSDPGDGSAAAFSSFSSSISTSGTYYFITGDVSSEATGEVTGVIVQNSSLTISSGSLSGSISNASLSASAAPLPVELSSFTASMENNTIVLHWTTASEISIVGFILHRRSQNETDWQQIASYQTDDALNCQNNPLGTAEYSYTDATTEPHETYTYRLSDADVQGNVTVLSQIAMKTTAITDKDLKKIKQIRLFSAFPNPFNPQTTINYRLEKEGVVDLQIFNVLG